MRDSRILNEDCDFTIKEVSANQVVRCMECFTCRMMNARLLAEEDERSTNAK